MNNLYGRVSEARQLWGRAVYLCRQAGQTTATALLFDTADDAAHAAAARICRYLAAFPVSLRCRGVEPEDVTKT